MAPRQRRMALAPVLCLLTGSLVWGFIWYPYRQLADWGLDSAPASLATYAVALLVTVCLSGAKKLLQRPSGGLIWLGLSAGITNIGFVWATTHGEVLRVVLLFYLVPVWTAFFAWILLKERIRRWGVALIVLAVAGAAMMLWNPDQGSPLPRDAPDWIALLAGIGFGLSNVLMRRVDGPPSSTKAFWVFLGCIVVGLIVTVIEPPKPVLWREHAVGLTALVVVIGALLAQINLVVQYGIERIAANRVPVIFIIEIVVAALSSWWLAGEAITAKEWAGGAMIVAASLLSGLISSPTPSASLAPVP